MAKLEETKAMEQFLWVDFIHKIVTAGLYEKCVEIQESGKVKIPENISEGQKDYYKGCMCDFMMRPELVNVDSKECQTAIVKVGEVKKGNEAVFFPEVYWCRLIDDGKYKGPDKKVVFGSACLFSPEVVAAAKRLLGKEAPVTVVSENKTVDYNAKDNQQPTVLKPEKKEISKEEVKKNVKRAQVIFVDMMKNDPEFIFYYKNLKNSSQTEELAKYAIDLVNEGYFDDKVRILVKQRLVKMSGLSELDYGLHLGQKKGFLMGELKAVLAVMEQDPINKKYVSTLQSDQFKDKIPEILSFIESEYEKYLTSKSGIDEIRGATQGAIIKKIISVIEK